MGIPKFYRWLSERYPLLNQKLTLTEGPPEIDNLYLDMNGIIHNCTHANRKDIGGVTEEDMMLKIFDYLEKLVQIVRPQKLLFMAIDGVAPRAKMNQQRSRRFKSAMERLKNEEEQRRKGEVVPEDAFDSNCITPGTEFMARLGKHLRFFIRMKMAKDPLWQKPAVVFSGHEVPGEGEHKIMEYIRWEKRQPGYQPNQRHCMYGLDADLVMLSLVTHEPHFCLLREVVSYTGSNRGQPAREVLDNPCAENFILFQIGLLREYFELEFGNINLPFAFDIERIVDDYVLLCMLVGNDFLPALPTLDIAEGALNKLMDQYKELLPKLGGYLTYAGDLDRRRLEVLLERIGQLELETLEERAQDAEYMENKRAKRAARMGEPRNQLDEIDAAMRSMALEGDAGATPAKQQGPTMMSREARQMMMAGLGDQGLQMWKDRYYADKLESCSPEERRQVAEHYIAGLHWVLEYYYRGVASWDWYYPYHYSPMASDMTNLDSIQVAFAQGAPFRPFEQLLAVLPAASSKLLPPPYRALMMEPESPIVDFYPATFAVDMEGKRADWEGVVLVPFVDEARLLHAVRSIRESLLSQEELARNQLGQIQIYQYTRNASETAYCKSTMPKNFPDLKVCHSRCVERPPPPPLPLGGKGFTPSLVPGTRVGLSTPPGMPTLKSLQVRPALRNAGINVLGTPSRKESLVLSLKDLREALGGAVLSAEQVASSGLLGARAYINWPYLQEARVVRVSDRSGQTSFDNKGALKVQRWQGQEVQRWETDAGQLAATFLSRSGIDVGRVDLVVGVKVCLGYIRHSDGTIEKTYSKDEVQVPLQAVIRQRPQVAGVTTGPSDDMPGYPGLHEGMQVVFLGKHHFGCMATVLPDLGRSLSNKGKAAKQNAAAANGHYRIQVQPVSEQVAAQALRSAKLVVERFAIKYYNSGEVASRVGINPRLLGRITGNMWARDGDDRYDLGLAIKTSARDVCVPGFSQPTGDGYGWMYSAAVINILQEYRKLYPWLWTQLTRADGDGPGDLRIDELLPGLSPAQRKDKVRELAAWIKSTPLAKRPLVKLSVKILSDEGVKALQTTMAPLPSRPPPTVEYENVPPLLLALPYTPGTDQVKLSIQGGPFDLGDRVVCVSGKGSPPYGHRGTVIGVYDESCEVLFDEKFGGGSDLNGRVSGKCSAFVPKDLLVCVNKPADILLAKHQLPRQQNSRSSAAAGPAAGSNSKAAQSPAGAKQAAERASQSALNALQPPSDSSSAPSCVPASVSVAAPMSPPVPSTKLLGAAMRSLAEQQNAHQQQQGKSGEGAGKVLLRKLSGQQPGGAAMEGTGGVDPAAVAAAAAAVAAVGAHNSPGDRSQTAQSSGSLAQLQKLVPTARVGSSEAPRPGPRPSSGRQQGPAPQGPHDRPPQVQQPFQVPPPSPQAAMMQPQMLSPGGYAPRAPYIAAAPHPHQPPFVPYAPGAIPVPGPLPGGIMAPMPQGLFGPPFVPYMVPPPPQPVFPQQPGPIRPMQPPNPNRGSLDSHDAQASNNAPAKQPSGAGQGRGRGRGDAAKQPQGKSRQQASNNDNGPRQPAPAFTAAPEPAVSGSSGLAPVLSHPIYLDTQQSVDLNEETASESLVNVRAATGVDGGGAKQPGQAASGNVSTSGGNDDGRPGQAGGKHARIPDAAGRGFRGRGRPVGGAAPSGSGPVAPGSQGVYTELGAESGHVASGRLSLDQGGQKPLVSEDAARASDESIGAGAQVPNPGAALLRQLVDAAVKAQSLDSGTELLRALQRK